LKSEQKKHKIRILEHCWRICLASDYGLGIGMQCISMPLL